MNSSKKNCLPPGFLHVVCTLALLIPAASLRGQAFFFSLKSAPPDLTVSLNGEALKPVSSAAGIWSYRVDKADGTLRFSAPSYRVIEYNGVLPKVIVQNPAGNLTIVSNWVSQNISIFDSDTKQLLRRVSVDGTPRGMSFSPNGSLLYIAIYDANLELYLINGAIL